MPNCLCRCGHGESLHRPTPGYARVCVDCKCPEFRLLETRESIALRGIEASV